MSRVAAAGPVHGPTRRARIRALLALVGVVVLLGGAALALRPILGVEPDAPAALLTGRVVNERGVPVPGASVAVEGRTASADEDGAFRLPVPDRPVLVRADGPEHLSRTQAAQPGAPAVIRLTSSASDTVSLRFGGDVMFGRRFYDRDEDGDRADGLLPEDASVAQHAALLDQVEPLLSDADVTVVNLETPLVDDVLIDAAGSRPADFHPTKDLVFTSAASSARALEQSGVDVVALGNNHVYDVQERGLARTLQALDEVGLPHFGAGLTVEQAWAPAIVDRRGQRVAFLGCTTVGGSDSEIPYVAGETQGGAAECSRDRLIREVTSAATAAATVVVQIHGGVEYRRTQTEEIRDLTRAAVAAGADVVVNGHPHVVGGVTTVGDAVVAESSGNLLFDQTLWPTFLSYLLRVDVRSGTPVIATVDPLVLEDYVPHPTVGLLADSAARVAAGLLPGPARLQAPGVVLQPGATPAEDDEERMPGPSVARLAPGKWVEAAPGGNVELGEDLLWSTGSFEDMDTVDTTQGGHLWQLGEHASLSREAACAGAQGVQLVRSPVSTRDVVAAPEHRQLVSPGERLSVLARVREASPRAALELRWYSGPGGPSHAVEQVQIPEGDHGQGCRLIRLDVQVPVNVTAARPFVRLQPPGGVHRGATLRVDDVKLVRWGHPGASGRQFDVVTGPGTDIVVRDDRHAELMAEGPFAWEVQPSERG